MVRKFVDRYVAVVLAAFVALLATQDCIAIPHSSKSLALKKLNNQFWCELVPGLKAKNRVVRLVSSSNDQTNVIVDIPLKSQAKIVTRLKSRCLAMSKKSIFPKALTETSIAIELEPRKSSKQIQLQGSGTAVFGRIARYQWKNRSTNKVIATGSSPVITVKEGKTKLQLIVADNYNQYSSPKDVTINTISAQNRAPELSIEGDSVINLNGTASFSATITDDTLPSNTTSIIWAKESGPGEVSFSSESSTNTNAQFSNYGKYVISATVSDGSLSTSATTTIIVNAISGECADNSDNDEDSATDMIDFSCLQGGNAEGQYTAECQDGIDNDGDGYLDFDGGIGSSSPAKVDPGCDTYQDNLESQANCDDGIDNDSDGWSDSEDPDCISNISKETRRATNECNDGIDNDGNGLIDKADAKCSNAEDLDEVTGPTNPECSDGLDNDDDGLMDYPIDPGCQSPSDTSEASEGRGSDKHNFYFSFDTYNFPDNLTPDANTRFNIVEWTAPDHSTKRVIWDDFSRRHHLPSYNKQFFHSIPSSSPIEAWRFITPSGLTVQRTHADLTYSKVSQESDRVIFKTVDNLASTQPSALEVTDDIRFYADTIYATVTIKNTTNEKITTRVPFILGSLLLGNFDDQLLSMSRTDPGWQKLIPSAGGIISSDCCSGSASALSEYPDVGSIGTYSPVMSIWGTNSTTGFTIGAQVLGPLGYPDYVQFKHSLGFDTTIHFYLNAELLPNKTRTFVLAFKFAPSGDWQSSLSPYKSWFSYHYGNHTIGNYNEATPWYCPGDQFGATAGTSQPYYNLTTDRFQTNYQNRQPTLTNIFYSSNAANAIKNAGINRFGIWKTALDSKYLAYDGQHEFSGMIHLLDPAIGAGLGNPISQLSTLTNSFANHNLDLFFFARPNYKIYGADIKYNEDGSYQITKGKVTKWVDLRNTSSWSFALNQLEEFVSRGVKGFYSDAGGGPGEFAFYRYAENYFQNKYGFRPYFIEEGAIDRVALRTEQIPLIKGYGSHSLLIQYLTPQATFHGGYINTPLNNTEISYILDQGYQFHPGGLPYSSDTQICDFMNRSKQNQHDRWLAYGQALGCSEPSVAESVICAAN